MDGSVAQSQMMNLTARTNFNHLVSAIDDIKQLFG